MTTEKLATATLVADCFWCVEAIFGQLKGVTQVIYGYAGGTMPPPTYQEVCIGTAGYAEAVRITFCCSKGLPNKL